MTATPDVVPIGHFLGTFPEAGGGWCVEVRVGPQVHTLDPEQARVWAEPWAKHPPAVVAELADRGLLAVLADGTVERFARDHRLVPLLAGLGAGAEGGYEYELGVPGRPLVTVDRVTYDLWTVAGARRCLWQACESYAHWRLAQAEPDPRWTTPAGVLAELVRRLDTMLLTGAACLDLAVPGASPLPWEEGAPDGRR